MTVDIRDVDKGFGVHIVATGILADDEYIEAFREHLTQDPQKFKRYRFSLSDYTGVTKIAVSAAAVKGVARWCRTAAVVNPDIIVAVVAEQPLAYGLSRMWQMLSDVGQWEIQVFKSCASAKHWIAERVKQRWQITDITFE